MKKFILLLLAVVLLGSQSLFAGHRAAPGAPPLACDPPLYFYAYQTSGVTAFLTWNAPVSPPGLGYVYEVRNGSGTVIVSGTTADLFAAVSGLSPSTAYTAYARSVCAPGDSSSWVSFAFTTNSCTLESIPYTETFESYTPPNYGCLTVEDANYDAITWLTQTGPAHSGAKRMSSGRSTSASVSMNDWVYTKGLSLTGGYSYTINFWYRAASPTFYEKLKVKWGTAPNHQAMTGGTIFDTTFNYASGYLLGTASITPATSGVYWVGFQCYSDPLKAGIYIDDISVCAGPYITDPVTGPDTICKPATGQVYSIPEIPGALSYHWTVPTGATIVSDADTNVITVDFSGSAVSGNITVYARNSCGRSNTVLKPVVIGVDKLVSVNIGASATEICKGNTVNFTATPTNGGIAPQYQWYVNGGPVGGATNSTFAHIPANQDTVYCVLTSSEVACITGNPATSNEIGLTVNDSIYVSVSITADTTAVCEDGVVNFTATPVNGGGSPVYAWYVNGSVQADSVGATFSYIPANNDNVYCILTSSETTCVGGNPATSNTINLTVYDSIYVSVSIAADTTAVCEDGMVYFTATPVNGGGSPVYAWYVNGSVQADSVGATFSYIPANNDNVYCILTSSETICVGGNPATSNTINLTVYDSIYVSVSIAADTTAVCEDGMVYFTATPVNGGGSPVYAWYVNGSVQADSVGATFSYIPANNDNVYCILTSSETICVGGNPATSNTINLTVYDSIYVSVSIAADTTAVCEDGVVNFTATPVNGGTTPEYAWYVNSTLQPGVTGPSFNYTPANNDNVYCILTSSENICVGGNPATSNTINLTVYDSIYVSVSIAADTTAVCEDGMVYFTATPVNGGGSPVYAWYVNGSVQADSVGATFSYIPANNDNVYCILTSSETTCVGGNPATSNTINLTVYDSIYVSVTIAADTTAVCEDGVVNFTATPVNGGTTPEYAWYVNSTMQPGVTGPSFNYTPANNDNVYCILTSSETICVGGNPATSNSINLTVYDSIYVSVSIAADTTAVCEDGVVNFTATPVNGGTTPEYAWYVNSTLQPGVTGPSFNYTPANNDNVYCILTSSETTCVGGNPATSNSINLTVYDSIYVSVTIAADTTAVCEDGVVNFTATPVNGGTTPEYAWYVNSTLQPGVTGPSFNYTPANNDNVYCILTSSETICVGGNPATSNTINLTVYDSIYVSVSIAADTTAVCEDGMVYFTATPVNGGGSPVYAWYVNGSVQADSVGATFSYIPANNDNVYCILTSSETICVGDNPATSNSINLTVYDSIYISVTIAADTTAVCEDGVVNFTATPVNGGTTPEYAWYVNSTLQPGVTGPSFNYTPANNDNVYCILTSSETICVGGNPATSNTINLTVYDSIYVSVSIAADTAAVCEGGTVNFTATPVNGGSTPVYAWYVNGSEQIGFTGATFSYTPANNDNVYCILTSSETTCVGGNPATSNSIDLTVFKYYDVDLLINVTTNPVCEGTTVTFNASAVNGGATPQFRFYVNDNLVQDSPDSVYSYVPDNLDRVTCVLVSGEPCTNNNPAHTDTITMSVLPYLPLSVSITASDTNICAGDSVVFEAFAVNGFSPQYQWQIGNIDIFGATNAIYGYRPANNNSVTCKVSTSYLCATGNPATSAPVTMIVNPILNVSVTIEADTTEVCDGGTVTFTAYPVNGGSSPQYLWKVNGDPQPLVTGDVFTYNPLNGDVVSCELTSSETLCVAGNPATSNEVVITVIENVTVELYIEPSANFVCEGTEVTYTAYGFNEGANPVYQWYVNDLPVSGEINSTYTFTPVMFDRVTCVLTSSERCALNNPALTDTIVMNVFEIANVGVTITASDTEICDGDLVEFTANPTGAGYMPRFQWMNNGFDIPGATNQTYEFAPADGEWITCMVTSIEPCKTNNPAISDTIFMTVHPVLNVSITISADTTRICAGGKVTFTSSVINGGVTPQYQWQVNGGDISGANDATFEIYPAGGEVITCVLTSSETVCVAGNPATSNSVTIESVSYEAAAVSIAVSQNPVQNGHPVTFTATPVFGGNTPAYEWFVNGVSQGPGSSTFTYVPALADQVNCVMTSNYPCVTGSPAMSDTIVMLVSNIPLALYLEDLTIHNGESICYDALSSITVAGTPFTFTIKPGGNVTMIAGIYIKMKPGTTVQPGGYLHAYISDVFCPIILPPVPATLSSLGGEEKPLPASGLHFIVYPNPTNGNFTLEQKGDETIGDVKVEVYGMRGERILLEQIVGEKKHEFGFSDMQPGLYFVKVIAGDQMETIKLVKTR